VATRLRFVNAVHIVTRSLPSSVVTGEFSRIWASRADFLVHEMLGKLRISQLFDIAADYPDSLPAIDDLRTCLARTHLQPRLVQDFRAALESRLLIPGAETTTIIEQYINIFK
jgi:anaphase-promoting complex subunit 2